MISTPNGKDLLYYETCRQAKLKGTKDWNHFELVELKWYQDPRYNKFLEWTRRNPETNEMEFYKEPTINENGDVRFTPKEWMEREKEGWKPRSPWYIKMCQQFNNDSMKIAQELDVSFLGSAANVVEPEAIQMQLDTNVREPLYVDNLCEDTWVWKEPIPEHRYLMSIDCSRGDAADSTAIEIIDLDGVDDDGMPCIEQVLEYHGKKMGDTVGEMANYYGRMYGEAFAVVDCVGGTGDACVLMMQRLKYKNLFYDDVDLKSYTIQREASTIPVTDGRAPGFHTNAVRDQMLIGFADMVRTNQFKIRSRRVIAELDTWIYKGPTARIDHQDGCHDDTLTCLAMGLFVMKFSLNKLQKAKKKSEAILGAWTTNYKLQQEIEKNEPKKKNFNLPFYSNTTLSNNKNSGPYGAYM